MQGEYLNPELPAYQYFDTLYNLDNFIERLVEKL